MHHFIYFSHRRLLTYVHESLHPQQRTGFCIPDAELVRYVVIQHETQTEGTEGIQEFEEQYDTDLTG
jgi:hypothetical protein